MRLQGKAFMEYEAKQVRKEEKKNSQHMRLQGKALKRQAMQHLHVVLREKKKKREREREEEL